MANTLKQVPIDTDAEIDAWMTPLFLLNHPGIQADRPSLSSQLAIKSSDLVL